MWTKGPEWLICTGTGWWSACERCDGKGVWSYAMQCKHCLGHGIIQRYTSNYRPIGKI